MANQENRIMISPVDQLGLSVLVVTPESGEKPKAVLQLLHGMCEYKERYLPLLEYLSGHGYACVIHDHRGHGASIRSRDDLGYMYDAGADGLLKDALAVHTMIRQQFPGVPVILFGHSMGSLAARCFVKTYEEVELDAVILSGPPSENPAVGAGLLLAKLQKKLFGGHKRGKLIEAMSFGSYARQCPESRCAWVCSDQNMVQTYEKDPLCAFTFTVDGYITLFELMQGTYRKFTTERPDLPMLYLGGTDDPCIGGEDKFEAELEHMRACGFANVQGKLYTGMRHEICNETRKEKVWLDMLQFVERCMCAKSNG